MDELSLCIWRPQQIFLNSLSYLFFSSPCWIYKQSIFLCPSVDPAGQLSHPFIYYVEKLMQKMLSYNARSSGNACVSQKKVKPAECDDVIATTVCA